MPRAGLSTASVVDAAVELVDERRRGVLTLAAVASRTGVATPSLYKHVRNLEALQQKVSARVTAELAQRPLDRYRRPVGEGCGAVPGPRLP